MKKMRNILIALGALVAALMTAACSDVNNASAQTQNSAKSGITVSGSLSTGADRSATSSLASDTITWKVAAATRGETGGPNYDSAIFGSVSEDMTFTITLPEAGQYYFTAMGLVTVEREGSSDTESVQVLQGITDILTVTADGVSDLVITASPLTADEVGVNTGKIKLTIYDESARILNIRVFEDDENTASLDSTFSTPFTYNNENPSVGVHIYKFCFDDAVGNTLYTCREAVTVFSSLTTDTWVGSAPYFVQNEDGSARFVITEELLEKYDAEVVPDTKMMLYNNVDGYKYYLTDNAGQTITSDTQATVTTSSSANSFCFDGAGYYYVIAGKEEDVTYIKSNKPDFGSETLGNTIVPDSMRLYGDLGGLLTVDRLTNKLYMFDGSNSQIFQITKDDGEYAYDGTNYIPAKTFSFSEDSNREKINFEAVFTVYNGVAYFASVSEGGGGNLVIAKLENAVAGDITGSKLVSLELGEMNLSSDATITDMLYQDGAVYMLLKDSSDGDSRGAVIKYDTVSETISTLGWSNEDVVSETDKFYVYYYSSSNEKTEHIYDSYSTVDGTAILGNKVVAYYARSKPIVYAPSDASSDFYGPSKFIAIKPRRLVISDEGIAVYTNNDGALSYKNVNRIVTVDLESFAIAETSDASVSFGTDSTNLIYWGTATACNTFTGIEGSVYISNGSSWNATADDGSFTLGIPCSDDGE